MDKVLDKDRFSIITEKLDRCYVCGSSPVHLHEVFYGTANRKLSKEDGLVIPLCPAHHNMSNMGVHFNKALDEKIKQQAEKIWLKEYSKTVDDFIKRYGKNYLD